MSPKPLKTIDDVLAKCQLDAVGVHAKFDAKGLLDSQTVGQYTKELGMLRESYEYLIRQLIEEEKACKKARD